MRHTSTVLQGALIISAGTFVSRLLGLVRENLLNSTFGASDITGAYNSAFSVPDLLYYLLAGGALSAAFIPVFTEFLAKDRQGDANSTGSSIANLMLIALLIGVVLELIFAPQVVRFVAPGYTQEHPELFGTTVLLTRVMCGMVIFTALSGLLTGILNSYQHFLVPTIVWNVYNLSIIFGITTLSKQAWLGGSPTQPNIMGVSISVVLGALLMAAIQLPVVLKYGFRYRPIIDFSHPGVKRVLVLFVPVMAGMALSQYNLQMIPLQVGSFAGPSAVTDIRVANRIVLLPFGLIAVAISTAAFPLLARLIARDEHRAFRETITKSLKAILLLSIPCAVGVFVLSTPLITLLLGGGKFGIEDIHAAAFILAYFIWAVLAMGVLQVVNRGFYAMKDTVTPVIVQVFMVLGNAGLGWWLIKYQPVHYAGIAVSTTLTTTLAALVLFDILRRRLRGLGGRSILPMTAKVVIASLLMGAAMFVTARALAPTVVETTKDGVVLPAETITPSYRLAWQAPTLHGFKTDEDLGTLDRPMGRLALQVGASMLAGGLVFFLLLWLLRVEEMALITAKFTGRLTRMTSVPETPTAGPRPDRRE